VRWTCSFLLLSVVACGGTADNPPPSPEDETLARLEEAGRIAYSLDRPDEAVTQYQAALKQAEARDDLTEISNLSFNLAVAQLRANRPEDALATTSRARAELTRRGGEPFPALLLAEATALYRTGAGAQADQLAGEVEQAGNSDTAAGASFLRGLMADEGDDEAGLRAALGRLSSATTPVRQADRLELRARLALRQSDVAGARSSALQAAAIRQEILDYRGMARALAVAGLAAERDKDHEAAADLYLRAGRSAAAQSDPATARPWLDQALKLTRDPATAEAARLAMDSLDKIGGPSE
jgi:tetratricopeptide (TPR) repeat protein